MKHTTAYSDFPSLSAAIDYLREQREERIADEKSELAERKRWMKMHDAALERGDSWDSD